MRLHRKVVASAILLALMFTVLYEKPGDLKVLVLDPTSDSSSGAPSVVKVLNENGYDVTHITGIDVTVEHIKKIGEADILILRIHSTIQNNIMWIFSGERFDGNRYIIEQMTHEVHRAKTSQMGEYLFAVGSYFIERYTPSAEGVTVLVMGCEAASSRELADVFLSKGAELLRQLG